jgi:CheY-like chemotaxis protein
MICSDRGDWAAFGLVLPDIQTPVMDGMEAAAAIRERERDNGLHLPVIALTGHGWPNIQAHCPCRLTDSNAGGGQFESRLALQLAPTHSYRRAIVGWMRLARRAGM